MREFIKGQGLRKWGGVVICIMLLCFPNARVMDFPQKIWMQVSMAKSGIYLQKNIPKNTGANFPHNHSILSGWGLEEFETMLHEE